MLNTEDVRDTRLHATPLPIQEQRGENANPMIMYICSRVFRGFERFFFFFFFSCRISAALFLTVSHNFKADSLDNANDWNMALSAGSRA